MSRPKSDGDVRQLVAWVPEKVKAALEKKAKDERKPERRVLTEALKAHLGQKDADDGDSR